MTSLRIADPCHESWDGMTPNREGRHCAACDKTVVDVTAMAPAAARAYLAQELPAKVQRGERVCVRAHADRSGRLLRGGVKRRLLTNGLAAVLAMAMADYTGFGPTLGAAEEAPVPQAEVPMPAIGGLVAPERMGDVKAGPDCLVVQPVAPITDAETGLTYSADAAAFLVTATRRDQTVAWTVNLTTRGVPGDSSHLIRTLVSGAKGLVVCYGGDPDGEPLQMTLDPATGKSLP